MGNQNLPNIDRGPMIRGVNGFLIGISFLAVLIRFVSRKLSKAGLGWDDWLCLAALPVVIVMNVLPVIATFHGLGKHFQYAAWDAFEYVQLLFFLDLLLAPVAITLVKASVIIFYRRTFRTTRKSFNVFLWALLGIVVAWLIAMFIVTIFTCSPIAAQWNPMVHGSCLNAHQFFLGQTTSNTIIDFILLLTPAGPLFKLHVSKSKKIALFIVFAFGYFVPVIAIMRLVTSNDIFNLAVAHEYDANIDLDLTWNYVDAEVWTFVEPAAGIVSCCIPASGFLLDWALKRSGLSRARKSSQGQRWTSGQASNSGSSGKTPNIRSFTRLREPSIRSNGAYLGSKAAVITDAGPTSMPRCLDGEELQQLHVIDTIDVTWEAV